MVADVCKQGAQVNIGKPSGGVRPLLMLEETFKAIEGPVARRHAAERAAAGGGTFYSATNPAYDRGVDATAETFYLDVLVTEDAIRWNRRIARIPSDYEKFFNTIQHTVIDAVQAARGVGAATRRFYQEAFQGMSVGVETKFGLSTPSLSGLAY